MIETTPSDASELRRRVGKIASTKAGLLNAAIGRALVDLKMIDDFQTEKDLGGGMARLTDLYCARADQPVRVEVMWRKNVGRADIANYALPKRFNYGRAIGLLTHEVRPTRTKRRTRANPGLA